MNPMSEKKANIKDIVREVSMVVDVDPVQIKEVLLQTIKEIKRWVINDREVTILAFGKFSLKRGQEGVVKYNINDKLEMVVNYKPRMIFKASEIMRDEMAKLVKPEEAD